MAVIVATRALNPKATQEAEFPVLSIGPFVDSGYVMQGFSYYLDFGRSVPSSKSSEYSIPSNPHDFTIGVCHFLKNDQGWFYDGGEILYKIVYGQEALESYGNGKMFERLTQMFTGD